jgi:phosphoglycolate phosphatase
MRGIMTRKLVLFDIDGTLLISNGAGRRALMTVLSETIGDPDVFGRVRFDGKTDPQIILELLREAGHDEPSRQALVEPLAEQYLELLEAELSSPDGPRPVLMAGAAELLDQLDEDERVTLGLLTGNLVRGAALKLRSVGIDPDRFAVGAFGSDSADRPDLPPIAVRRAEHLFGRIPMGEEIVIIGDTPADVTCGQGVGARAIAVATGSYSSEELSYAGAYFVVENLVDASPVIDAIFA